MEWKTQSFCRFPAFASVFVDGCSAIEETRKFPEHKCVEAYQFICYVLNTILSILAVVKTVMEIIDQDFDQNSSILISASVFLDVVVFYLAKSGPIVAWMGNRMLKMKIKDTIEECNARHLRGSRSVSRVSRDKQEMLLLYSAAGYLLQEEKLFKALNICHR